MTKINDGGPAFPHYEVFGGESYKVQGLTKRDWFAGQALSIVYMRFQTHADPDPYDLATQAYFIADAMLAAREAPND